MADERIGGGGASGASADAVSREANSALSGAADATDPSNDDERSPRVRLDNYAIADAPRLGVRGWLRWMWRQVTSMRVALILLLILGIAAIPGSVLPQWPQDAPATRAFIDQNPFWGPLLDRLGFLDTYGSAWFTAIYVLLFASLIGCIIPRCGVYWRELRSPVPPAPSRLDRYEPVVSAPFAGVPADAIAVARARLDGGGGLKGWFTAHRIRVDEREGRGPDAPRQLALSAHRGHVRELGNLIFHLALVGILIAMALGSLLTFRGQAIVIEGRSFTNAVVDYDTFEAGRLFDPTQLEPWTISLDSFESGFDEAGRPQSFTASVTLTEPGTAPMPAEIEVNRPLQVDGAKIYLQGNGFAPELTVTDSDGNVAFAGPTPFLPQDGVYTSQGVVKVPDVSSGPQIGIEATLYPDAIEVPIGIVSRSPNPDNPVMLVRIFTGDLGLDDGVPQNVYQLDQSRLSPVQDGAGEPVILGLVPGQTATLPDGLGTITWNALPRFVALDLRADPTLPWLLAAAIAALIGLGMSLFGRRRRVWLIVPTPDSADGAATVVEAAAWAPAHDPVPIEELENLVAVATGGRREDTGGGNAGSDDTRSGASIGGDAGSGGTAGVDNGESHPEDT